MRDSTSSCWLNGVPLHWASGCASFSIFRDGVPSLGLDYASTEAIVASAFSRWSQASCGQGPPSINAAPLGPVDCQRVEFNPEGPNANVVVFYEEGWPHDDTVLGLTTLKFSATTGEIFGADMEIQLTPALDPRRLEFVVTHEAGHFLGLAHSADPSSIMFSRYDPLASQEPTLSADDTAAICSAYDPSEVVDCDFTPHAGFDDQCGGDVVGGCSVVDAPPTRHSTSTWLVAGGVAWLFERRRARRPSARRAA